jgi:ABC-type sugar transport system ATPase subunit
MTPQSVELKGISKSFGTVMALRNVDLRAYPGECLGIIGENGAGKSTLMNVLSGVWPAGSYSGEILLSGKPQSFSEPKDATQAGIAIIHQELALFPELSVAENIFISDLPTHRGFLSRSQLLKDAKDLLQQVGFELDPSMTVSKLSIGQKQLVEIAKALSKNANVLILDEPTSALSDHEIERLMTLIDSLKAKGITCLYISHKFNEILRLCERIVVLRDGESVFECHKSDGFQTDQWIEKMVGRKLSSVFPAKPPQKSEATTLLRVTNLSYRDPNTHKQVLKNVSFELKQGEVLGVAGLMGSKRTDLLLALFGALDARGLSGQIQLRGQSAKWSEPSEAIRSGICLVTEDRKHSGLFLDRGVCDNLSMPLIRKLSANGIINQAKELELFDYYKKILRIKTSSAHELIRNLSGGNQQKALIGRCLALHPSILLLDEPTRGVDVNAKAEIYHLIRDLIHQGLSIIMVSSELPEIVALSDRVLVMNRGEIKAVLSGTDISQERILERALS